MGGLSPHVAALHGYSTGGALTSGALGGHVGFGAGAFPTLGAQYNGLASLYPSSARGYGLYGAGSLGAGLAHPGVAGVPLGVAVRPYHLQPYTPHVVKENTLQGPGFVTQQRVGQGAGFVSKDSQTSRPGQTVKSNTLTDGVTSVSQRTVVTNPALGRFGMLGRPVVG